MMPVFENNAWIFVFSVNKNFYYMLNDVMHMVFLNFICSINKQNKRKGCDVIP